MKVLLIGHGAREHAIAEQIAKSSVLYAYMGHKNPGIARLAEKYFIGDITNPETIGFWATTEGIDIAFVGSDPSLAAGVTDALLHAGIPVASPTKQAARIEWDKAYTRELLARHKIPGSPEHFVVRSEEELKMAFKELEEVAVKPVGLTGGKGVKVMGDHFKTKNEAKKYAEEILKKDGVVVVEEKLVGEEFSLQAFVDGSRMSAMPPVQDFKRAFENDTGPNCYSSDTEILTNNGWKRFDKLTEKDKVAVYNPRWNFLQFQKPKKIYWMKYSGKMISFKNRDIDLLVTPNHRMLLQRRKGKNRLEVVEAGRYKGERYILQAANWNGGRKRKYFNLPGYKKHFRFKSIKIDIRTWARFLGLYLSEGYVSIDKRNSGRVYICQSKKSKHFKAMKKIIGKLPFKFSIEKNGFRINSIQLATYLKKFGNSNEKYVPSYIKNADKETILEFLKAFCMGDGDIHHGKMRFSTSSKKLSDDLQEMIIKTGHSGVITVDRRTTMVNPLNKKLYPANPIYSIEIKPKKKTCIRKNHVKTVDYDGYVGCVTVSTGFVLVRRNGRVAISGNTGGMGSYSTGQLLPFMERRDLDEAMEIMEKTVKAMEKEGVPFTGILYGGFMATADGVRLLEYNARFGDPEAMNVLPLLRTEFVEILWSMIEKRLKQAVFAEKSTVVKYLVPEGYPDKPKKDAEIKIDEKCVWNKGAKLYFGSVYEKEGKIYTTSSRAVALFSKGDSLEEARFTAEGAIMCVKGPLFYRKDIGTRENIEKKIKKMKELRG